MARTPRPRHRRRKRLTPRRWLPFVALIGLVVAAAVFEPTDSTVDTASKAMSSNLSTVPAVTADDAISTAWYCGGGSAVGGDGVAEMTVVVANAADTGATADVTMLDARGEQAREQIDIPARGRARLVPADIVDSEWVGVVVEVRGGRVAVDREVSGPLGFDTAPCSTEASDRWYVPSGSTLRGAEEYLSLFNPFPDATSVDVSFATNSGLRTPRSLRGLSIPGGTVRVVKVSETVTERSEIAATVRARVGRLIVDRVQTYDGSGDPQTGTAEGAATTPAPRGLISTPALTVRAPRWVVPGARVSQGVRNQLAIANPSGKVAEVDVVLTPEQPELVSEVEPIQLSVKPHDEVIVDVGDAPGVPVNTDLWIDVRSIDGVPVVVERLAFFGAPSERTGAAAVAGSPLAATRWLVTQGGPTRTRATTVPIANAGAADAAVTVYELSGGNRTELAGAAVTVPAGDRRSLDLSDATPAATLVIESTRPVVVGSSIAVEGGGVAIQSGFAFPEAVVALPAPG